MRRPLALALVLVLGVAGAACTGDDDSEDGQGAATTTTTGEAKGGRAGFSGQVDAKFRPLVDALTTMVPILQSWREGKTDGPGLVAAVDRFAEQARPIPAGLASIKAKGDERTALSLYVASARLYRELAEVLRTLGVVADPVLASQIDRAGSRLRILADRVYDRGALTLEPGAFDSTGDAVDIRRPPDVPDWKAEGLAAGPPLDDEPPSPPETIPERSTFRSEQPESAWRKAVAAAGIPPAADLAAALADPDAAALRTLAGRLEAAARKLDEVADPEDGRERAATVRLGLLVHAEAARTAQAAIVAPAEQAPALSAVAKRLALIGDTLWDDALPERRTGLDPKLLE